MQAQDLELLRELAGRGLGYLGEYWWLLVLAFVCFAVVHWMSDHIYG